MSSPLAFDFEERKYFGPSSLLFAISEVEVFISRFGDLVCLKRAIIYLKINVYTCSLIPTSQG